MYMSEAQRKLPFLKISHKKNPAPKGTGFLKRREKKQSQVKNRCHSARDEREKKERKMYIIKYIARAESASQCDKVGNGDRRNGSGHDTSTGS